MRTCVLLLILTPHVFLLALHTAQRAEEFFKELAEEKQKAMDHMENLFNMYETTLRNHGWFQNQPTDYAGTLEVMLGRAANLMHASGSIISDKSTVERVYRICKQSKHVDETTMLNLYKICRDSARAYALKERRVRETHYPDRAFYHSDIAPTGNMDVPAGVRAKISFYRSPSAHRRGFGQKK